MDSLALLHDSLEGNSTAVREGRLHESTVAASELVESTAAAGARARAVEREGEKRETKDERRKRERQGERGGLLDIAMGVYNRSLGSRGNGDGSIWEYSFLAKHSFTKKQNKKEKKKQLISRQTCSRRLQDTQMSGTSFSVPCFYVVVSCDYAFSLIITSSILHRGASLYQSTAHD